MGKIQHDLAFSYCYYHSLMSLYFAMALANVARRTFLPPTPVSYGRCAD